MSEIKYRIETGNCETDQRFIPPAIAGKWDSTKITFDSTIITFDQT